MNIKKRAAAQQKQKFIRAAREHGASEDEAVFDANLKRIAPAKPKGKKKSDR